MTDNTTAVTFGAIYAIDLLKRSDQQKLPIIKKIGPRYINWYIVVLIMLFPGVGLLHLFSKEYFCPQYMSSKPDIADKTIIGWRDEKKHVNKNKFVM